MARYRDCFIFRVWYITVLRRCPIANILQLGVCANHCSSFTMHSTCPLRIHVAWFCHVSRTIWQRHQVIQTRRVQSKVVTEYKNCRRQIHAIYYHRTYCRCGLPCWCQQPLLDWYDYVKEPNVPQVSTGHAVTVPTSLAELRHRDAKNV